MKPLFLASLLLLAGCATLQTQVEIKAPASAVRAVLYDFGAYPKWNPFITKVDGDVAEGNRIDVTVMPPGGTALKAGADVTSVTPNHLAWEGSGRPKEVIGPFSMNIPGVLKASYDFTIEEVGPGRTLFRNDVDISGATAGSYDLKPIEAGMDAMNEALKKRAEDMVGTQAR
jgi:Polyketide cyclase / dehydrase and lipid transport